MGEPAGGRLFPYIHENSLMKADMLLAAGMFRNLQYTRAEDQMKLENFSEKR